MSWDYLNSESEEVKKAFSQIRETVKALQKAIDNYRPSVLKERYELGNNVNSKVLSFAFSLSAEIERNLISQRTKEESARKKAEGMILGRPKGSKSKIYKLTGKEEEIKVLLDKKISKSALDSVLEVYSTTETFVFIVIFGLNTGLNKCRESTLNAYVRNKKRVS